MSLHGSRAVDIRLLPSIVPEDTKNEIALLIEPELSSRIDKFKNLIDAGIIEDSLEGPEFHLPCLSNSHPRLQIYLRRQPVRSIYMLRLIL